ncbi:hypothetical protein F1193_14325 [Blastochloris sulfoviridis]|uniref:Uncharacterized protein n=1 Tax=Blastochloris sulfoviridis TaxID=50712 RepID=A0A5M6HN74_9HYPH|nr:hypothetical protein F1193_14325 [Blastochloris sulfoviridis]
MGFRLDPAAVRSPSCLLVRRGLGFPSRPPAAVAGNDRSGPASLRRPVRGRRARSSPARRANHAAVVPGERGISRAREGDPHRPSSCRHGSRRSVGRNRVSVLRRPGRVSRRKGRNTLRYSAIRLLTSMLAQ